MQNNVQVKHNPSLNSKDIFKQELNNSNIDMEPQMTPHF
jgi:hypothetical protein